MSEMVLRRAQLDEKLKQQIRQRVKKLLKQKGKDSPEQSDTADESSDDTQDDQDSEGTVYLFDAADHSRSRMAIEFNTRKEYEQYKKQHDMAPGTKVKILDEGKGKGKSEDEDGGRQPAKEDEKVVKKPAKPEEKKDEKKPAEKDDSGDKAPAKKDEPAGRVKKEDEGGPNEPLHHSHPSRIPEGTHRQVAIKDHLIDEFGAEAKDWKVHKLAPTQLTPTVKIRFPDGSEKKYGELSADEKTRVDRAVGEGLAASKGMGDYTSVTPAAFQHNKEMNLARYDDNSVEEPKNDSTEPVTKENVGQFSSTLRENGRTMLKKYSKIMSSASRPMAEKFVDDVSSTISEGVRDGSLSGVSQKDLDAFVGETVKRMLHQEVETRRRSLGDHGIRHVAGNCRSMMSMFQELQGSGTPITGKQKLEGLAIMADHDIGYTVGEAATSAAAGKKHKGFSKEVADQEKDRYDKIFGREDGDRMRGIIATHDEPTFDWEKDPVGSSVRLADSVALFGEEKVQDLFLRSPKATELACKMRLAASAKPDDKQLQESIKSQMHEVVDGGEFEDADKEALHGQIDEMSEGKFSTTTDILSRFSGTLNGFKFDPEKQVMNVNMKYSSEGQMVDELFGDEIACRQFEKFAGDMNGTPVRGKRGNTIFKSKDTGKPVLQLNIDGFGEEDDPQTAAMRDFKTKTARSELRQASMLMYPPPSPSEKDIGKAKKAVEAGKDKFSTAEWKELMKAFDDESGDPGALAKKLGMWPLLKSEYAFLESKTASARIAQNLVLRLIANRIAVKEMEREEVLSDTTLQESVQCVAGMAITDPEVIEALKREGFRMRMGYWVKTFNFSPDQEPDFEEEWRAEQDVNGKLWFRSRYPRAGRPWGSGTRNEFWPKSLLRFAARGQQTQRKDKDLMQDTGGITKNRQREPSLKPPRSDSHNRYRTKDKTPEQRDPDVDRVTKEASVHPLDVTVPGAFCQLPEENYHRKVYRNLTNILADVQHVSEKDFAGVERIGQAADGLVRSPKGEEMIQVFLEIGARPEMCAEGLYYEMVMKGKTASGFESMAQSMLARFPRTLREAVQRA